LAAEKDSGGREGETWVSGTLHVAQEISAIAQKGRKAVLEKKEIQSQHNTMSKHRGDSDSKRTRLKRPHLGGEERDPFLRLKTTVAKEAAKAHQVRQKRPKTDHGVLRAEMEVRAGRRNSTYLQVENPFPSLPGGNKSPHTIRE